MDSKAAKQVAVGKEIREQLQNPNLAVGDIVMVNLSFCTMSYVVKQIENNNVLLSTANGLEMWVQI